jgi:orotidine-5'-phosphate decarboxylase
LDRPTTGVAIALDFDTVEDALPIVEVAGGAVDLYKIGPVLFTRYGPEIVEAVRKRGGQVFLDLKFHDIPNVVGGGARAAAGLGVRMLTVHCAGGVEMMRAAVEGSREGAARHGCTRPLIAGVTVLTSTTGSADTEPEVLRRAGMAMEAGADGVVCSTMEVGAVKREFGDSLLAVVPGIRLADQSKDDQARVGTPGKAASEGADYIVVGRSITRAADPIAALRRIREEVRNA